MRFLRTNPPAACLGERELWLAALTASGLAAAKRERQATANAMRAVASDERATLQPARHGPAVLLVSLAEAGSEDPFLGDNLEALHIHDKGGHAQQGH